MRTKHKAFINVTILLLVIGIGFRWYVKKKLESIEHQIELRKTYQAGYKKAYLNSFVAFNYLEDITERNTVGFLGVSECYAVYQLDSVPTYREIRHFVDSILNNN